MDLNYRITSDYSTINPPVYNKILNLYNTILIPKNLCNINVNIGDKIYITNLTTQKKYSQTVVIDCGNINLGYEDYYYFYIANGVTLKQDVKYSLTIDNVVLPLSLSINQRSTAKLIIGLLVLSDNYKYEFDGHNSAIINMYNKNYKISIADICNKFNYYVANKNTTIIKILDNSNFRTIQEINTITPQTDKFIRPLFNHNFPLGSLIIHILGVSDTIEYQICVNNNIYLVNNNKITIQNLESGQYSIKIIDKNGPVLINTLNNNAWNKDFFEIYIPEIKNSINTATTTNIRSLPVFYTKTTPKPGLSNIMINLPYNQPVEIIGPNNFYYKSDNGYFYLNNIQSGSYTIKQNNQSHTYNVHTNDTTYINGLI